MIRLVVSGDEQRWRPVAARLRNATLIPVLSLQSLPALTEFDGVLLTEPKKSDAEQFRHLLADGKHLLLTAQSWLSGEMVEALTTEARQRGVHLAILNPDHFLPSRRLLCQQLEAGKFGLPGLIRLHRWEPPSERDEDASHHLPTPLMRDLEFAAASMKAMPNRVFAVGSLVFDRNRSQVPLIHIHLGFPGGGMGLVDYSSHMPPGDDYVSFSVIGSSGAAYADDQENMQLLYRGGRPQSVRVDESGPQLSALAQDFIDGVQANRDFSAGAAAWMRAIRIANAVRESLATRHATRMIAK